MTRLISLTLCLGLLAVSTPLISNVQATGSAHGQVQTQGTPKGCADCPQNPQKSTTPQVQEQVAPYP